MAEREGAAVARSIGQALVPVLRAIEAQLREIRQHTGMLAATPLCDVVAEQIAATPPAGAHQAANVDVQAAVALHEAARQMKPRDPDAPAAPDHAADLGAIAEALRAALDRDGR